MLGEGLQQFIEGQPSSEIRVMLASNRPANLDTAVQRAVQAEAAYHMEARRARTQQPKPAPVAAAVQAARISEDQVMIDLLKTISSKLDSLAFSQSSGAQSNQLFPTSPAMRGRGRGLTGDTLKDPAGDIHHAFVMHAGSQDILRQIFRTWSTRDREIVNDWHSRYQSKSRSWKCLVLWFPNPTLASVVLSHV